MLSVVLSLTCIVVYNMIRVLGCSSLQFTIAMSIHLCQIKGIYQIQIKILVLIIHAWNISRV